MKTIASTVLLAIVALLVFVQTRPDRFHVERSATINASSETVFPHINDFRQWTAWSPWEKLDPQMQRSYEGPTAGTGAGYHWRGNHNVGEGSAKITESTPGRRVAIDLEFIKPFKGSNTATFTLAGTRVTWAMDGENTVISKVIGMFMSMDTMIGTEFERGLVCLKGIAENAPAPGTEGA